MGCSAECGNGTKQRTRLCDDPPPKAGGEQCLGESLQSKYCFDKPCGLGKESDCLK